MKKLLFLLLPLLLLNTGLACITNGVQIQTEMDLYSLQVAMIMNARAMIPVHDEAYYLSLANDSIGIRLNNETISFAVINEELSADDIDWNHTVSTELYWMNDYNVTNITMIPGITYGKLYDNVNGTLTELNVRCFDRGFEMPAVNTAGNYFAILLALLPALAVFVYYSKLRKYCIISFLIGGLGWFTALILRQQILLIPLSMYGIGVSQILSYIILASVLAGVFEEGIRYLLMKYFNSIRIDWRSILSMGLGWGFTEALMIYGLSIGAFIFLFNQPLSFLDLLPGALERNSTVLFHVALGFIVYKAFKNRRYLLLAVGIHFLLDFTAVLLWMSLSIVWLVELFIFLTALATAYYAYLINKKEFMSKKKEEKHKKKKKH